MTKYLLSFLTVFLLVACSKRAANEEDIDYLSKRIEIVEQKVLDLLDLMKNCKNTGESERKISFPRDHQ